MAQTLRFAVISDIHSNLEALNAVLEDVRQRGIQRVFCLGDVVGYGPNPKECIDLIGEHCEFSIKGNHDEAIFFEPFFFNPIALRAIHWTRDLLNQPEDPKNTSRMQWLDSMPLTREIDGMLFTHGSPRDPCNEYITDADIYLEDYTKFQEIFSAFEKMLFVGHTHVPCIITEGLKYLSPADVKGEFQYSGEKLIINCGSVGQPRDGNSKASYLEVDGDAIRFHRVPYKFVTTMQKIRSIGLSEALAERLVSGT